MDILMAKRVGKPKHLLPPGRPKNRAKLVLDSLAEALMDGLEESGVQPGDLLPPERLLAERHQVGRITVRAALKKLVRMGALECYPRVGYRVSACRREVGRCRPVGLIRQNVTDAGLAASKSLGVIEARLAQAGRGLLIGSSCLDGAGENECILRCKAAGVAGLIVTPATHGDAPAELMAWIRAKMPVVLEGHPGRWLLPDDLSEQCDQVDIDNKGGVEQALAFFRAAGHVRIGFVTSASRAGSERAAAYLEAMRSARTPEWILDGLANDRSSGEAALARWLALPAGDRPSAVVCSGSDNIALGLIAAARSRGVRCPKDLAVVSFGDNRMVDDPGALAELASIEFDQERMSQTLIELLAEQMSGARRAPRKIRVPVTLSVRASGGSALVEEVQNTARTR